MKAEDRTGQFLAVTDSHKGIIYKVARAYTSSADDRQDLVQEILVQLWRSFHRYDPQYRHSTWIYRIALNTAISHVRGENRRSGVNQALPDSILSLDEGPADTEAEAALEYLHQCIRELREIDRAVILLWLERKTQQEISHILGLTPTHVGTRVARIKQQLKNRFTQFKPE